MASGSMSKHVAKDGKTTWRVRVDVYDPITNRRRQPQRTYPTKRARTSKRATGRRFSITGTRSIAAGSSLEDMPTPHM